MGTEGDSEQKNDIICLRLNRISLGSPVAIFVLELLGLILPVHYHRLHKKNISGVETKATGELYLVH